MNLKEQVLGSEKEQAVRLLQYIRQSADALLRMMGENPEQLDPEPDPVTGCKHPDKIEVTTFEDEDRTFLCSDCGAKLVWVPDA